MKSSISSPSWKLGRPSLSPLLFRESLLEYLLNVGCKILRACIVEDFLPFPAKKFTEDIAVDRGSDVVISGTFNKNVLFILYDRIGKRKVNEILSVFSRTGLTAFIPSPIVFMCYGVAASFDSKMMAACSQSCYNASFFPIYQRDTVHSQ